MDKSKRIVFTIMGTLGALMYFKSELQRLHHVYIEGKPIE